MSVFTESLPYRIVTGDAAQGTLSHAYLLICPDERNLRAFLKELAKVILGADARAARLIDEESYADCRILPAEGAKASVADVRDMLDDCYIKPTEGDRKLFVIDRMQEMLPPAQNKLLKVLEEPPANVHFLLGATAEFPVLTTVKSRSKRLELLSFAEEDIEKYIRAHYPLRPDAKEIATASGGVLGRAQELAEGDSIADADEETALFVLNLSPAGIPAACRKYSDRAQAVRFLSLLRLALRNILMLKLGKEELMIAGGEARVLRRAAARYSEGALIRAQEKITAAERDLKFNANVPACLEALFYSILEG